MTKRTVPVILGLILAMFLTFPTWVSTQSDEGQNMIYNGGPDHGYVEMTHSPWYGFCQEGQINCSWLPRTFGVVRDAASWHPYFVHTVDEEHDSVLVINGNDQARLGIPWVMLYNQMYVEKGEVHNFSADLISTCCNNWTRPEEIKASIEFGIVSVDETSKFNFTAGATATSKWVTIQGKYVPEKSGLVYVAFRERTISGDDNDYGIANVYFGRVCQQDHDHRRHDVRPGKSWKKRRG